MKDTLKFAIMLMACAFVWTVINPVHILVTLLVAAFPVAIIFGVAAVAVIGYRSYQSRTQEEDDFS